MRTADVVLIVLQLKNIDVMHEYMITLHTITINILLYRKKIHTEIIGMHERKFPFYTSIERTRKMPHAAPLGALRGTLRIID